MPVGDEEEYSRRDEFNETHYALKNMQRQQEIRANRKKRVTRFVNLNPRVKDKRHARSN